MPISPRNRTPFAPAILDLKAVCLFFAHSLIPVQLPHQRIMFMFPTHDFMFTTEAEDFTRNISQVFFVGTIAQFALWHDTGYYADVYKRFYASQ